MHRLLHSVAWGSCLLLGIAVLRTSGAAIDPPRPDGVDGPSVRTRAAFMQAARRSSDPRLSILYAQLAEPGKELPLGTLVERTRGSTDPLALELLFERCQEESPSAVPACDTVDVARRWTVADAQNVVPWLALAAALDRAGDHADADGAWTRAGRASEYRGSRTAIARLVSSQLPKDGDPRARYERGTFAIGVAAAVPIVWLKGTRSGCKAAARQAICAHVANLVDRDADMIVDLQVASALSVEAQQPESLRTGRQRTAEALQWALLDVTVDDATSIETMNPHELATLDDRLERMIARGDVTVARDILRERGLSTAQGSARYAAYMATLMDRLHPN